MLLEKFIHHSFAIIFAVIPKHHPLLVANTNLYLRYSLTFLLLGAIQINEFLTSKLQTTFWKYYRNVTNILFKFSFLYMICDTFLYFEDYRSSSVFIIGLLVLYLYGVYFRTLIKKTGLNDFIFTIFVTQAILVLSEQVAYQTFYFQTMALFSPINLLCFSVQICFHGYVNENAERKKELTSSQQSFQSAYKVLGKEDSFKMMTLITLYIWVFLGAVAHRKRTLM